LEKGGGEDPGEKIIKGSSATKEGGRNFPRTKKKRGIVWGNERYNMLPTRSCKVTTEEAWTKERGRDRSLQIQGMETVRVTSGRKAFRGGVRGGAEARVKEVALVADGEEEIRDKKLNC